MSDNWGRSQLSEGKAGAFDINVENLQLDKRTEVYWFDSHSQIFVGHYSFAHRNASCSVINVS